MITAADTNILLDILIPDESHLKSSKALLDECAGKGQLIICEIVYSELASQFFSERDLKAFLSDTGIRLIHSGEKSLYMAGERWKEYTKNKKQTLQCPQCGKQITASCTACHFSFTFRQRILGDFIIGAHALLHAETLISRDRGFYKTYFKDLKIA